MVTCFYIEKSTGHFYVVVLPSSVVLCNTRKQNYTIILGVTSQGQSYSLYVYPSVSIAVLSQLCTALSVISDDDQVDLLPAVDKRGLRPVSLHRKSSEYNTIMFSHFSFCHTV